MLKNLKKLIFGISLKSVPIYLYKVLWINHYLIILYLIIKKIFFLLDLVVIVNLKMIKILILVIFMDFN